MKYIGASLGIVFLLILSITVFAQEDVKPSISTEPAKTIVEDTGEQINVSDISLLVPTFEDKIYKSGDVIDVTLSVVNNDGVDYAGMSIVSSLVVYSKEGGAKQYGYQNSVSDLFIPKNNTKEISFKYVYPEGVSSVAEDTVRLEISLKKKTGENYGNVGSFIKIVNVQNPIEIIDTFLATSKYEYALQEGPMLQPDEIAQIITVFKNNSGQDIELHPVLKVYESEVTKDLIQTKKYDPLTLGVTSDFILYKLDLPVISKAGVYQGELSFTDANGINQAPVLYVRWIVDGDFAKISNVSINATTFKKGDIANVDVVYTGPPVNIDTGEVRDVGMGSIRVDLYNEKDQLVGTGEQPANFSVIEGTSQFQIELTKKAKTIKATVSALKNGVELSSYSVNLTNPDDIPKENKLLSLLGLIVLFITLIVVTSFMYKKKLHKKLVVMGLFALMFAGGVQVSEAAKHCSTDNDFCATVNMNGSTYTPGADMSWSFSVQSEVYACQNQGGGTDVSWTLNGGAGSMTDWYGRSTAAEAEYNKPSKLIRGTWVYADWFHSESRRDIAAFYPASLSKKITAPSVPGNYNLHINVSNTARYKDGGSTAFAKSVPAFNFTVTVACPAGQNWNGWGCVTPVNGSCNNSTLWSCYAGGADSGSDQGTWWQWRCAGSNGGGDAWCGLAKPVNGSCNNSVAWACNVGTAANGSDQGTWWQWTCEGANGGARDWCGIAKPVNGSCGSAVWSCTAGGADSGNSDTSNVWWRCAGSNGGSDAWCSIPLPPAPTDISTQCSPDGKAVAMYWKNQPGYDRVYFRNFDNTAQAHYGTNDNYQNNWAYLTNITPGHSYNWWIHTRRWDGLWSNAVGQGYVCTAQQPSNINVSCSPDGKKATFTWKNPAGYNRVYFRNYDDTVGGWGTTYAGWYGYNDDLWGETAVLDQITPGHSYHWWMHTRDSVGNGGPAVGMNFICTAQQPTGLSVSCSADGRTAIFSWINPAGYNRVYFRNYDDTAKGYYGNNDDVWGNTYTLGNITPGNNYGWWIHTRDAAGNAGPAVSGNFTCSATPTDQCTNVSGIQASVPASANKNADGTCSCSTGKHFEGALCVDDVPVAPTFSVSCSVPSVVLKGESRFQATTQNSTGAVTYKWKEKDNITYISGATNSLFNRTYSTVDSHRLYIEATDQKSTVSNYCNATVDCDSSHFEGQKVCDTNTGIESTWSCSTTGWTESKGSCSTPGPYTGPTPEVGTFMFAPDLVADASSKCGLNLSATNVSSCTLTAPGATPIVITGTAGSISKLNDKTISVGRYNLSCTGMGATPVTKQFGFKTCSLNPDVRER